MRLTLGLPLALLLAACGDSSDTNTAPNDTTTGASTDASTDAPGTSSGTTAAASETGNDASTTASPTTAPDPTTTTAPDPTTTDDPVDTTTTLTTGDDTGPVEELPPIESAEILEAWLAGGAYKQWAVESQVHASTGPHGGNVRTYVNAIALTSLMANNSEHPQDAATVKELYADGNTIIGYAVSRKTAPKSEGGATWYWYERVNNTTYADGLGVGLCTGCHVGGADYILTPYPLQ